MRVVAQVGYSKISGRKKVGQLVRVYVNDNEVSWNDSMYSGKYLTSRVEANKGTLWYLCDMDLNEEDTLKISVKTSIARIGTDEERTFESLYYVNQSAPVREIMVTGVGMKNYPLVKGRVLEIASVSEADNRKSELDNFLRDGF